VIDHVWVWCFTDKYPARIDADCEFISPNNPLKIGDIEKMLPFGMYLHKKYDSQRFHAVAKLEATNIYVQKKNLILEQQDQIKEQRRRMQTSLLEKKIESTHKKSVKKMP